MKAATNPFRKQAEYKLRVNIQACLGMRGSTLQLYSHLLCEIWFLLHISEFLKPGIETGHRIQNTEHQILTYYKWYEKIHDNLLYCNLEASLLAVHCPHWVSQLLLPYGSPTPHLQAESKFSKNFLLLHKQSLWWETRDICLLLFLF